MIFNSRVEINYYRLFDEERKGHLGSRIYRSGRWVLDICGMRQESTEPKQMEIHYQKTFLRSDDDYELAYHHRHHQWM